LQFQTRLLAAAFFVLCNLLLWWVDQRPCASYMDTWLGLTPMVVRGGRATRPPPPPPRLACRWLVGLMAGLGGLQRCPGVPPCRCFSPPDRDDLSGAGQLCVCTAQRPRPPPAGAPRLAAGCAPSTHLGCTELGPAWATPGPLEQHAARTPRRCHPPRGFPRLPQTLRGGRPTCRASWRSARGSGGSPCSVWRRRSRCCAGAGWCTTTTAAPTTTTTTTWRRWRRPRGICQRRPPPHLPVGVPTARQHQQTLPERARGCRSSDRQQRRMPRRRRVGKRPRWEAVAAAAAGVSQLGRSWAWARPWPCAA
jgi:hypothetical protein